MKKMNSASGLEKMLGDMRGGRGAPPESSDMPPAETENAGTVTCPQCGAELKLESAAAAEQEVPAASAEAPMGQ